MLVLLWITAPRGHALLCNDLFGCDNCNQFGCQQCKPGSFMTTLNYFTPFSSCLPCLMGCSQCLSLFVCLSCFPGYNLTNGVCSCSENCAPSNYTCPITTYNNYPLTTCTICPSWLNCLSCSNSTFCTSCGAGFQLSPPSQVQSAWVQQCSACPLRCMQCSNTTCSKCFQTYQLVNNSCECLTNPCETCVQGYYLNQQSQCKACNPLFHCMYCETFLACTACNPGFYMASSVDRKIDLCIICPATCVACVNSYYCLTCNSNNSNCSSTPACQSLGSTCLGCSLGSNYTMYCNFCHEGYFIEGTTCLPCAQYCISCISAVECQICEEGFIYVPGQNCRSCPEGCKACKQSNECTQCVLDYYLRDSICLPCGDDCLACVSAGYCQQCTTGYQLIDGLCYNELLMSQKSTVIGLSVTLLILGISGIGLGIFIWR